MDFEKVCMMFAMQEPFYGVILSSMEKIPTDKIDTFAVARSGNVFKLYYNKDFYESLSVDCVLQVLRHEVLHIAFNHFSIWDYETTDPNEHYRRNCAEDLEVNCYLDRSKMDPHVKGLFPKDYGWDEKLGTRKYYELIRDWEKDPQNQNAQNPFQPCNGGQGKVVILRFDEHAQWPKEGDNDMAQIQQIIDELLDFAAEECEKSRGTIPGEMVGKIEAIRKKPKPVADWKRYFRRYLGNEFSEFIRKSKKRESRRFPDAAGNRHRRKSHILVGIDTSGSVSMPELQEFFGQIRTLTQHSDFHVVECDARVQHEYDYNGRPNLILHGGGGTDFQPVIDIYNQNRRIYDALVYFTDGGAPIPNDTPKDCLWVISSKGDHNKDRYKVNGASVVCIPAKQ